MLGEGSIASFVCTIMCFLICETDGESYDVGEDGYKLDDWEERHLMLACALFHKVIIVRLQ